MAWSTRDIPSQAGKLAVVTGANSGIGWNTALELARAGAEVVLTARSEDKGASAVARIQRAVPAAKVRFALLDLASQRSVHAFAETLANVPKLDLLVNNAGVMRLPTREQTEDGFERQLATNYLGPFALTLLLLPKLQHAPAPRVTTVGSLAANMGLKRMQFEDLQWEHSYDPWKAYSQSKLADLLFMVELGRRAAARGINLVSNAAHPGYARTNLQTSGPGRQSRLAFIAARLLSQDAAHGALPTLRAATHPSAHSNAYIVPDGIFQLKGSPVLGPLPRSAQDVAAGERLWALSEDLTQLSWRP